MLLPLLLNLTTAGMAYSYGVQADGATLSHGVQPVGERYRYDRDGRMT